MPTSKFKLIRIDANNVDTYSENYNSYFHTAAEAPQLLVPDERPYAYSTWLPLIASTQAIPQDLIQTVKLSASKARLLLSASKSSLLTGVMNRMYEEDLQDEIAPVLRDLKWPEAGLFMRLDMCSPKDGAGGIKPLKSVEEIILKLITSARAASALTNALDREEQELSLVFLPYNEKMSTAREFRVFCAPDSEKIAAVSQYKWHAPFFFQPPAYKLGSIEFIIDQVMEGIERVHQQILDILYLNVNGAEGETGCKMGHEMAKKLKDQGFTFDVMWDEQKGTAGLIELNVYGARSGCGSCLFHWIRDMDVLYGKGGEEVEFRISL